jgi:hypothetical protein
VDVKGPLPDFDLIAWTGRVAVLLFDSNALTNSAVQSARDALATELKKRRAVPLIADLPLFAGNGPDDFIAAYGDEHLWSLIQNAKRWTARSARQRLDPPTYGEHTHVVLDPGVDLPTVLGRVESFIRRYVVLSDHCSRLLALWVVHTHSFDGSDYTPYVHIQSPVPECGKTRLLEVLESLVARPWMTGRVTAAVVVRKIDKVRPTLLLDESDAAFGGDEMYAETLRGILNTGFHRGGTASACVGQGSALEYHDFRTFSPKAIAGLKRLPATIESRSIPIVLKRRTKDEPVSKWRRRTSWAEGDRLRGLVAGAVISAIPGLQAAIPSMPEGLSDRVEDVVEPLFAIADLAGQEWPRWAREAAVELMGHWSRNTRDADQNRSLELLKDLQTIFASYFSETKVDDDAIFTRDVIARLIVLEDSPWPTCRRGDKPIDGQRLAALLRPFEIRPAGTIRIRNETEKGYRRAPFEEAFRRYLPSEASQGNSGPEKATETAGDSAARMTEHAGTASEQATDTGFICDTVTPHEDQDGKNHSGSASHFYFDADPFGLDSGRGHETPPARDGGQ